MSVTQFRIFTNTEFNNYILNTNFSRAIKFIQNHHTWKPSYNEITAVRDEMYWLESMRETHIRERGWNDIGQNITTFPSGKIGLCRPINVTPAGIYGANAGAICIEHFGNFDEQQDVITEVHKDCIINVNAVLCIKFGLKPTPAQIVYHHWYDTKGKRFSDNDINSGYVLKNKLQKTCPGTNFFHDAADAFKGNTILSAEKNFYPQITNAISALGEAPAPVIQFEQKQVDADILNIRAGKGSGYTIIGKLHKGEQVNIYETSVNWCRINANTEAWVSAQYLK